ncbi:MAG: helix-turn-helix domain-containing protein [Marmoricola sp.]
MPETADLRLSETAVRDLRDILPEVAGRTVSRITDEVPSYAAAFTGPMGETIRNAVELALGGFISLAARSGDGGGQAPTAQAVDGAYQLGRGEARGGRTVDALLSAYRIGARVSWREMSAIVVRNGVDAPTLGRFAELVFAYIDELSAASVAGHNDELATTGRVRERLLERLADHLLDGSGDDEVAAAAERAGWALPVTLTAVLVPESQVRAVRGGVPGETLQPGVDLDGMVALFVPDVHGRRRSGLLRALAGRASVAGPPRPWSQVRASFDRAQRLRALGLGPDSEEHLAALVLTADPSALSDLRARALAPLAELRPSTAEKLLETLRSWLLHQGRREAVAEDLFVHAQTVRYRMGQLREAFGDRLDDPQNILELTLALALPPDASELAETAEPQSEE